MSDDTSEQHVREDDLVALALGMLEGGLRSQALAHVDECSQCGAILEQYSLGADGLLQVAPELDPPVGFEVRVLERIRREQPAVANINRHRPFIAAVAALFLVIVGISIGHFALPSSTNTPNTLTVVHSSGVVTASLVHSGQSRGTVVLFNNPHPWLLMTMQSVPNGSLVICKVVTKLGQVVTVGSYWITSDSASWSARLPIASTSVRSVIVTTQKGSVLAQSPTLS